MQAISIAERLWLEPTLLGTTLNYCDQTNGSLYRVGIGFRSLAQCDKVLKEKGTHWGLQDNSLFLDGDQELTLTFCPGTAMERKFVLTGNELETFKEAIHFLTMASEPRLN